MQCNAGRLRCVTPEGYIGQHCRTHIVQKHLLHIAEAGGRGRGIPPTPEQELAIGAQHADVISR
jgi:hypothetical protein